MRPDLAWRGEGPTNEGVREGVWIFWFDDNSARELSYEKGRRHGKFTEWRSDGSVRRGTYVNDVLHGDVTIWHPNSDDVAAIYRYEDGKLHGLQVLFNDDESEQAYFERGLQHGPREHWKRGVLVMRDHWVGGVREGVVDAFFDDGTQAFRCQCVAGKIHGPFEVRFPSGAIRTNGSMDQGLEDGLWSTFSEEGLLLGRREWHRGELVSDEVFDAETIPLWDSPVPPDDHWMLVEPVD